MERLDGVHFPELLPLPLTAEALAVVSQNVEVMQDILGRQILIENPSSYLRFRHSTIPEWEFITCVAERTGCGILCDVNDIYVSAYEKLVVSNRLREMATFLPHHSPAASG